MEEDVVYANETSVQKRYTLSVVICDIRVNLLYIYIVPMYALLRK